MKRNAPALLLAMLAPCGGARAAPPDASRVPAAQHLVVDLDGDGGRDGVSVLLDRRLGTFVIVIRYDGEELRPFTGEWRPGDRIGLEWRVGDLTSDVQCRDWKPGLKCGYPVGSHSIMRAVAVHHSRLGQFILLPRQNLRIPRAPLTFTVSKAFEPTTRLKTFD